MFIYSSFKIPKNPPGKTEKKRHIFTKRWPFIHQALSGAEDQRCVGFQLSLEGLPLWRSATGR